jgi:C4-dicarboxylate transporter, DctM subunit
MPIVFALGIAGVVGLALGGFPLQMLPSSLVAGSQNWVLGVAVVFIGLFRVAAAVP